MFASICKRKGSYLGSYFQVEVRVRGLAICSDFQEDQLAKGIREYK
jgi:hypothetical protein